MCDSFPSFFLKRRDHLPEAAGEFYALLAREVDHRAKNVLAVVQSVLRLTPRDEPRAVRLRRALEDLGPIFVKFGQVLSTRARLIRTPSCITTTSTSRSRRSAPA